MGGGLIFHGETVHGHVFEVVSGTFVQRKFVVQGAYPDLCAKLPVSTCSDYDLGHSG